MPAFVILAKLLVIDPAANSVPQFAEMVVPEELFALIAAVVEKHVGAFPGTQFPGTLSLLYVMSINVAWHVRGTKDAMLSHMTVVAARTPKSPAREVASAYSTMGAGVA